MTAADILISAGGEALHLRGRGEAAAASVAGLGNLLGCPVLAADSTIRPDAELLSPDAGPAGCCETAEVLHSMRSHRIVLNDGVPAISRRERLFYTDRHQPVEWRILLALGAAKAAAENRRIALLHGVLLGDPFPGTLLFGRSGIGKSTTLRRYLAAGGGGVSDDAILIGRRKDGTWSARAMPTWKGFATAEVSYRIPELPVARLIHLDRASEGEKEHFGSIRRNVFLTQLYAALLLHVDYVLRSMPDAMKKCGWQGLWLLAGALGEKFAARSLYARLDGELFATLRQADADERSIINQTLEA